MGEVPSVSKKIDLPDNLTPAQVLGKEREFCKANPINVVRLGKLKIKSKEGKLIPLIPNNEQNKVLEIMRKLRKEQKPIRVVILKGRQFGISTLMEGLIFSFTSQWSNVNSLIMADDDDGSTYLFEMTKLFHEMMLRENPHMTPQRKASNEKKLEFLGKRSQILIDTAKNVDAGRKYTFHNAHLSEVSRFRDFNRSLDSLMQSVPDHPDTMVVMETTANGEEQFCIFWRMIKEKFSKGETEWVPIFLSWKDHLEYARSFVTEEEKLYFMGSLSRDELEIMKKHDLSTEQMNWRRHTISNKCRGSEKIFRQEYPLTDEEAFVTTGKKVFSDHMTKPQERNIQEPIHVGSVEIVDNRTLFVPEEDGYFRMFKPPVSGHRYVIGSDSSDGIFGGDYACGQVIDRTTWEQVGVLHGNIAPDILGQLLFALGRFYKWALVAPEINGPGLVTVLKLRDLGYPNLVHRNKINVDDQGNVSESNELGWHTNSKTKPIIVSDLSESLREILLTVHDGPTMTEIKAYSLLEDGTMGASAGYHDDRVISLAIAVHFAKTVPEFSANFGNSEQEQSLSNRRTGY